MKKVPEKEILSILDTYCESYLKGAWETAISFLDENVRIIGSTAEEIYHNKREAAQFFRDSEAEIAGRLQMRNRQVEVIPVGDLAMAEEHLDVFIDTGETWNFYSRIRVSTLLRETGEGWKIIQQHGSVPDHKASEGETIGFEQVSKENQELRDAIKRRTTELEYKNRELEIEAALERVRALMAHPDFDLRNPNKVRALIGSFAHANPLRFHAADGSGYAFLRAQVLALDPANPQIAARLLRAISRWRRYDEGRQARMREVLEAVAGAEVSKDVYEIAAKSLEAS